MRRLSSLSSTTRIFLSVMTPPLLFRHYAGGVAVSQTVDVDLLRTFRVAPRDVGPDALRPEPNRRAPSRQRADGALQLPLRTTARRPLHPSHRGHGPRALDGGIDARDRRGAPLARARLGRGAVLPERARDALPHARRRPPRARCALP